MEWASVFNQLPTDGGSRLFSVSGSYNVAKDNSYINNVPGVPVYLWDYCWVAAQLGQRVSAFVIQTDVTKGKTRFQIRHSSNSKALGLRVGCSKDLARHHLQGRGPWQWMGPMALGGVWRAERRAPPPRPANTGSSSPATFSPHPHLPPLNLPMMT